MKLFSFQKKVKSILLIIFILIVLFVTIVLGKQASVFFAKASSCQVKKVNAAQVTGNSAVISWETEEVTQGRVEYGINATNLSFSAPEAASGKIHNVPLTLLTPNTVYYYLINIGNNRCDSTGQKCSTSCVPYSFTTAVITPQADLVLPLASPTGSKNDGATPSATSAVQRGFSGLAASPTSSLTLFCRQVQANIGKNSSDASRWATLKTLDVDNNGIINGLDVFKCQKSGK